MADPALDAALADRGWTASPVVDLLTGPLPAGSSEAVVADLDDAWLDCWWSVDARGGEAEKEVARSMLTTVRHPVAHVRLARGGEVLGVARGVAQGAWLGVFQVAVVPHARRQGVAGALLRRLQAWGEEQGTTSAYLQVSRDNPGRALYEGMAPAGSYRYRTRP